jgi:hypothetical protein
MIIYNVTLKMDWSIEEAWLKWMKEKHIPQVMQTNCFTKNIMVKLIDIEDEDGPTYAMQYFAESKSDYNRYIEIHSATLREEVMNKWGTLLVAFRTVMQVVN